jgi:RNA recognition motif-containing protein
VKSLISVVALAVLALGVGAAQPAHAAKKLFVGNLPYTATAADVQQLATRYGVVTSVAVVGTDVDGVMSAEATVTFDDPADVALAAQELHGMEVGGQRITANVKKVLLVGSKVKEVIREAGLRSDGELVQALSDKVHEILGAAIERCTANGRSTVRPHDL